MLFPIAVVAAIYGVLFSADKPDYYFNKLLAFGRKTDRFINLFNQHNADVEIEAEDEQATTSDELLAPYQQEIEKKLIDKLK